MEWVVGLTGGENAWSTLSIADPLSLRPQAPNSRAGAPAKKHASSGLVWSMGGSGEGKTASRAAGWNLG